MKEIKNKSTIVLYMVKRENYYNYGKIDPFIIYTWLRMDFYK